MMSTETFPEFGLLRIPASAARLGLGPDDPPRIMAILNATPDSFSDGGRHLDVRAAVDAVRRWMGETEDGDDDGDGVAVVDVGGESTRPGARRVEAEEQIRRVVPVIRHIRDEIEGDPDRLLVSIDTTRAAVAEAALDAGADIVNDVAAGTEDARLLDLVADRGAGLILMHRLRPPNADRYSDAYATPPSYAEAGGVVAAVATFLRARLEAAMDAGVPEEAVLLDPGLGFGKTVEDNYRLVAGAGAIADATGRPLLGAASRKSFIGAATGQRAREEASERVEGSIAVALELWMNGVRLFRVHDVHAHRRALAVATRIRAAGSSRPGGTEPGSRGTAAGT